MTVNPTSGSNDSNARQVNQAQQQVARQAREKNQKPAQDQSQTQRTNALPQDRVRLNRAGQQSGGVSKSSGDVDHDGDSR